MTPPGPAAVIGAGLAGAEAALVLAARGIAVDLFEMRPGLMTPAHRSGLPAELVCSNSLKSLALHSAHGVLKAELALLRSPLLAAAKETAIPAGSALAVDRERFSRRVEEMIAAEPRIRLIRREISSVPAGYSACIIAAGPLASDALCEWLTREFSAASLHFYDAIAPIVSADSVDRTIAFSASRNQEGEGDYLNCPFSEDEYRAFYAALREADRAVAHAFEDARFFEGCLPVEVMAERGEMSLAFGPLKPIGLTDPRTGGRPFAVCQLRRENEAGTCFNMVGFQTRLTVSAQREVFRLIPGLGAAEFLRYGSIHRNSYLDSPRLLSHDLSFKLAPSLFLAGQLSGSEGYTESIATGHCAALFAAGRIRGTAVPAPPAASALGSLLRQVITPPLNGEFTPSNIHFGLFPPLPDNAKRIKKRMNKDLLSARAIAAVAAWIENGPFLPRAD